MMHVTERQKAKYRKRRYLLLMVPICPQCAYIGKPSQCITKASVVAKKSINAQYLTSLQ